MNDWSGSGPEGMTRSEIVARNPHWTDADRETVGRALDAVSNRVDHAYRTMSYWALKPAAGTSRVPLYIHPNHLAVDCDVDLPPDLASRAFPGRRGEEDQYVIIELSTASHQSRTPRRRSTTPRPAHATAGTCPVHFVELPATGMCDQCE